MMTTAPTVQDHIASPIEPVYKIGVMSAESTHIVPLISHSVIVMLNVLVISVIRTLIVPTSI